MGLLLVPGCVSPGRSARETYLLAVPFFLVELLGFLPPPLLPGPLSPIVASPLVCGGRTASILTIASKRFTFAVHLATIAHDRRAIGAAHAP